MVHERAPIREIEETAQYAEDYERYRFALQFVQGQRVLDVACGTGYGSRMLATEGAARYVIGADLECAPDSVNNFRLPGRVEFAAADVVHLPFRPAAIDVAISMETIEHLVDPQAYLRELRRVLRPGGIAVISTPVNETASRRRPANPYHIREYSYEEFIAVLESAFKVTGLWSQVTAYEDDTPQWSRTNAAASVVTIVKRLMPRSVRIAIRKAMGSSGLHAINTEIVAGRHERACVQIAVCQ